MKGGGTALAKSNSLKSRLFSPAQPWATAAAVRAARRPLGRTGQSPLGDMAPEAMVLVSRPTTCRAQADAQGAAVGHCLALELGTGH